MDNEKVLKKIRALLARANEAQNDNEFERQIALRQATNMMDQYSISMVDLDTEEDVRGAGFVATKTARWKANIVNHLSNLYGCKAYRSVGTNGRTFVIGRQSHRTIVLELSEYVIASVEREAKKYKGTGKSYINSFKLGAATGVYQQTKRIIAERQRGETTSTSKALAVVNHYALEQKENEQWLKNQNVTLRKQASTRASDYRAYTSGYEYGNHISLNNQLGGSDGSVRRNRQLRHG
jgi:hypothetical protein